MFSFSSCFCCNSKCNDWFLFVVNLLLNVAKVGVVQMEMSVFTSRFPLILLFGLIFGWFGFCFVFLNGNISKHEGKLSLFLVSFCQILFLYLLILQLLPLVQRCINGSGLAVLYFDGFPVAKNSETLRKQHKHLNTIRACCWFC